VSAVAPRQQLRHMLRLGDATCNNLRNYLVNLFRMPMLPKKEKNIWLYFPILLLILSAILGLEYVCAHVKFK